MSLTRLPVIVGFGGINAAGRASFNHAYRRLVIDALDEASRSETYRNLATLMNLQDDPGAASVRKYIDDHTLILGIIRLSRRVTQTVVNERGSRRGDGERDVASGRE